MDEGGEGSGPGIAEVDALEIENPMQSIRKPGARDAYRKNAERYRQWAREGK